MLDRKGFVLNAKFSLDEKLSKFEKLLENEQKYQNNLNHQYKKLTENLFLLNNELLLIRKREKQYEIDNQAYRNQIHNTKNQINKLDQQLLKQQELIYHQDFLKQTIDRRLNRIIGENTNEKHLESDLKIRELQNEYEKKKSQYDQLQNQIKILNEELRIIKLDSNQLITEKNDLNEKFLQFDLYITSSDKIIKKINTEKEVKHFFLQIH
jgi:chromosome segregation ATPase